MATDKTTSHKNGLRALSPLMLFVIVYFASSIIAGDFYKMPITISFLIACVYAVAISGNKPLKERIEAFCCGAGEKNIMLMVCIFILAGAFANSARDAGCIDSTVNFALSVLPDGMVLPGLFIAACFISLSIGTSVGTIVALTPIAAGIASATESDAPMLVATVVGGSFFGDNLSFISDTTIVATSTQRCKLSDKFRVNAYTAIPAAIITIATYALIGKSAAAPATIPEYDFALIIPYLIVIATALYGVNVLAVLTLGILATGIAGITYQRFDFFGWCHSLGSGITSMGDLIVVAMLAGGLLKTISDNGALNYIIKLLTAKIKSRRSCEMTIAMLVSMVNVCTANNTVAILTVSTLSKEIAGRYGVDPRKSASILDTFSCCVQSILPYGAQILMATGLAAVGPMDVISRLYYPFILFAVSILAIFFRYPKKYS